MRSLWSAAPLGAVLLSAAAPVPLAISTVVPFETLEQCFRSQWEDTGKLTAINTAAGAMLDFAFDSVGTDGKVAPSHLVFSIEDRGTERRVTATARDTGDAVLSREMLDRTMSACAPDAARH